MVRKKFTIGGEKGKFFKSKTKVVKDFVSKRKKKR